MSSQHSWVSGDTHISGEDHHSISSTPPPPPAKQMRLSIQKIEVTRGGKRNSSYILAPLAKRFRFSDAPSSSSSSSERFILYPSSPDRMSPDLLIRLPESSSPTSMVCRHPVPVMLSHLRGLSHRMPKLVPSRRVLSLFRSVLPQSAHQISLFPTVRPQSLQVTSFFLKWIARDYNI